MKVALPVTEVPSSTTVAFISVFSMGVKLAGRTSLNLTTLFSGSGLIIVAVPVIVVLLAPPTSTLSLTVTVGV